MNLQYSQTHPLMKFLTMDLLKMDFADSSFTSFLDKGTLDALMSENSKEATERAMKMFQVNQNIDWSQLYDKLKSLILYRKLTEFLSLVEGTYVYLCSKNIF